MKFFILIIFFFSMILPGLSQVKYLSYPPDVKTVNRTIDSLQKILKTQEDNNDKLITLNKISELLLRVSDIKNSLDFSNKAIALADKIDSKSEKAFAYKNAGEAYLNLFDFVKSRENLFASVAIYKELNDRKNTADVNFLIMNCYRREAKYPDELEIAYENIRIYKVLGDKNGIAQTLADIAEVLVYQGNNSEALKKFTEALQLFKETGMKLGVAYCSFSMAALYLDQGKYAEALGTDSLSILIYREADHKTGLAEALSILGDIYHRLGKLEYTLDNKRNAQIKFNEALNNYFAALKIVEDYDRKAGISWTNIDIGEVYLSKGNYKKARYHLVKGLSIAKEIKSNERMKIGYNALTRLDSATGNYRQAYEEYKLYIVYRDSLVNEEYTKRSMQTVMQYEFDKKQDSIKAAQDKKDIITTAEIKNHKLTRNFSVIAAVGIVSFLGLSFYRYRRRKNLQSQQEMLNERLRISRELHDEVGATLSGIAMYSHLAKEQIKNSNTVEVEKSLNVMQQSSGEMVNKLNDIVWLVNPEQDSLQKLIERLEEYTGNMASIKNMQVKINVPEKVSQINLPMESRRNIYLFCKEAINNAVKYSGGNLLELNIKETDGKLEFSVSDNGKGFDAVMVRRGNGLENMQKRADEVGAKLVLTSKENEGTSLSLVCKIT